jgi:group I intron endonuclease
MWTNLINGKRYVGSAVNLLIRLRFYFSNSSLQGWLEKGKSHIYPAILEHGLSNFSLTILEYCEVEQCLEREDFYLSSLNPEYNINKKATAPFVGRTHSDETLKKYRMPIKGRIIQCLVSHNP